jgi:hypothetical protein
MKIRTQICQIFATVEEEGETVAGRRKQQSPHVLK